MSALQKITPVMLTQDASTMMGVLHAAALQDILGMDSAVKVHNYSNSVFSTVSKAYTV